MEYKFERIEKKFWLTQKQYADLLPLLKQHLEINHYGLSNVSNIYYDTDDFYLISRSLERPDFKEKLRIRSYNNFQAESEVFIELKRKCNGLGYKRRASVKPEKVKQLLDNNILINKDSQIVKEIIAFQNRYHAKPKIYISYNRLAFTAKENSDLRVTVDSNIQFGKITDSDFKVKELNALIEGEEKYLLEIKTLNAIPVWLVKKLSKLKIYQSPFSKVGTCYKKMKGIKLC